jgi:signal recognition particle subunit SRP72
LENDKASDAVAVFETLVKQDPSNLAALAGLIVASSTVDPSQAQQYSQHLAALVSKSPTLPKQKTFSADLEQLSSFFGSHAPRVKVDVKKKRKHRKNKPRLPKNFDPNIQPDPERWTPMRQRIEALKRRRKGKGKHDAVAKGPQGAVSSLEEMAMDASAAAPKAAPIASSGSSSSNKKKKKKSKW